MSSESTERGLPLEANPNWEGGRTITSHGYVLVKRPDHPRSHSNGYIYEHRLVAEDDLGRALKESEHVHHKNGDKQDNRPENLEVLTAAEHRAEHRENEHLRGPGEPNPVIRCSCGCGETLSKYDESGRPRSYVSGHNPQPSPVQDAIIDELSEGPKERSELVAAVDRTEGAVSSALKTLKENGDATNPILGTWSLPENADSVTDWREENQEVECACGCGETLLMYDDEGRERQYISGHNSESWVRDGVLRELEEGQMKRSDLADVLDAPRPSISSALTRLEDRGLIEKAEGWGMWKRADSGPNGGEPDAGQ